MQGLICILWHVPTNPCHLSQVPQEAAGKWCHHHEGKAGTCLALEGTSHWLGHHSRGVRQFDGRGWCFGWSIGWKPCRHQRAAQCQKSKGQGCQVIWPDLDQSLAARCHSHGWLTLWDLFGADNEMSKPCRVFEQYSVRDCLAKNGFMCEIQIYMWKFTGNETITI